MISSKTECLPDGFRALVLGGAGGIGHALKDFLENDPDCSTVISISRSTHPFFDLESPDCPGSTLSFLGSQAPFDLVIDATGILSLNGKGPEKSMMALVGDDLHRIMQINAIGPLLVLKALAPHLTKGSGCYAKLSARVGSITDNKLGGWYGYRASKTALNMFLQTAAIELQRERPLLRIAALQPGTVRTNLSADFLRASNTVIEPETSALRLLHVIRNLPVAPGATFIDHEGKIIPW